MLFRSGRGKVVVVVVVVWSREGPGVRAGEGVGCPEHPQPGLPCLPRVPREGASPACASAAVEVETASQASEPASQASDEEDAPATDIYFVSPPGIPPVPFFFGLVSNRGLSPVSRD